MEDADQPQKMYSCDVCHKTFRLKPTLQSHMMIHTCEKPFTCTYCGKQFRQSSHCKIHTRIHTDERPYSCKICGHKSRDASGYRKHVMQHSGERPFKCHICSHTFIRSAQLQNHLNMHTGHRPFECQHCNRRYTNLDALRKHQKHQNKCPRCKVQFSCRSLVVKHKKMCSNTHVVGKFLKSGANSAIISLNNHIHGYANVTASPKSQLDREYLQRVSRSDSDIPGEEVVQTNTIQKEQSDCIVTSQSQPKQIGEIVFPSLASAVKVEHQVTAMHDITVTSTCNTCSAGFLSVSELEKHLKTHFWPRSFDYGAEQSVKKEPCDEVCTSKSVKEKERKSTNRQTEKVDKELVILNSDHTSILEDTNLKTSGDCRNMPILSNYGSIVSLMKASASSGQTVASISNLTNETQELLPIPNSENSQQATSSPATPKINGNLQNMLATTDTVRGNQSLPLTSNLTDAIKKTPHRFEYKSRSKTLEGRFTPILPKPPQPRALPHVRELMQESLPLESQLSLKCIPSPVSKRHQCLTHGRSFTTPAELQKHVKMHTGETTFVCLVCGQGYSTLAAMHMHKKIHSSGFVRPLGRRVSTESSVVNNVCRQLNIQSMSQCEKEQTLKQNGEQPKYSKNQNNGKENPLKNMIQCFYCTDHFRTAMHLKDHIISCHKSPTPTKAQLFSPLDNQVLVPGTKLLGAALAPAVTLSPTRALAPARTPVVTPTTMPTPTPPTTALAPAPVPAPVPAATLTPAPTSTPSFTFTPSPTLTSSKFMPAPTIGPTPTPVWNSTSNSNMYTLNTASGLLTTMTNNMFWAVSTIESQTEVNTGLNPAGDKDNVTFNTSSEEGEKLSVSTGVKGHVNVGAIENGDKLLNNSDRTCVNHSLPTTNSKAYMTNAIQSTSCKNVPEGMTSLGAKPDVVPNRGQHAEQLPLGYDIPDFLLQNIREILGNYDEKLAEDFSKLSKSK